MHRRHNTNASRAERGRHLTGQMRRQWSRRRLRLIDDVDMLEQYQRDLEQEAADVAERIRRLAKDSESG